jgi:WD40 repeat protein
MVTAAVAPNPGGPQVLRVTGWDLKAGKKLGEFEDMNSRGAPFVAAASNSFAVVATTAGRLRAYDYEAGRGGDEFEPGGNRADAAGPVLFSPDGKWFVTGHAADPGVYGVRVHDWPGGRVLHTLTGHAGPVTALVFSPDGKTLASGSQDGTVLLWDMAALSPK